MPLVPFSPVHSEWGFFIWFIKMDENKIILQVCEFTGQYEYSDDNNVILWVLDDGQSIEIDFNQVLTTMKNWVVYDKTFYSIVGLSIMSGIVVDLE